LGYSHILPLGVCSLAMTDSVNHPPHYESNGSEVIDIIEAFELGFHLGNVVKYVLRAKKKNGTEDLKKARWYLDRQIAKLEAADKAAANG
jgi:hypothetical protein